MLQASVIYSYIKKIKVMLQASVIYSYIIPMSYHIARIEGQIN
jgi:hypothetical protein